MINVLNILLFILCSNPSLYNGDDEQPVYRWNRSKEQYTLDSLANVLLTDSAPPSSIFSKQPVHVCRNVSFVVYLHKLDGPVDVRADENGVWVWKGSPVAYVSMHTKEDSSEEQ